MRAPTLVVGMPMKYLFVFLLLTVLPREGQAMSVGIGYSSKKAVIWRYWEIYHGKPIPKMLVYNTTDTPIKFFLRKTLQDDYPAMYRVKILQQLYGIENDTIVMPVTIQPHEYGIWEEVVNAKSGFYDAANIDGQYCGIMPDMGQLPELKYQYRYYSPECLNGGNVCLVGKDKLFSIRGEEDRMVLYFDCAHKDSREKERRINADIRGINSMTMSLGGGVGHVLSASDPKTDFAVNVAGVTTFTIEVAYTVSNGSEQPCVSMYEALANGSKAGVMLPVLAR